MSAAMKFEVAIVGGGIIGLSCAWQLAQSGLRVAIVERGALGGSATHAAAGMLAAQCEAAHHAPDSDPNSRAAMAAACWESCEIFPAWAAQLESESGLDIELSLRHAPHSDWRTPGILYLATQPDDRALHHLQTQNPAASTYWHDFPAVWLPEEGQVENRLFARALEIACRAQNVAIFENCGNVICQKNGDFWQLKSADLTLKFDRFVLCGGAWSDTIALPFSVPVRPLCGQMLALNAGQIIDRILYSSEVYLVPRRDGRLLVGATMEERGFDCSLTAAALHQLLESAWKIEPKLRDCEVLDHWAGLRPATPDGLPIIGETALENIFIATGHGRNGILLAPQTALWIRDLLTRKSPENHPIPAAFSPFRFAPNPAASTCR